MSKLIVKDFINSVMFVVEPLDVAALEVGLYEYLETHYRVEIVATNRYQLDLEHERGKGNAV